MIARTLPPTVHITEAAHWHPRRENDPAVVWLRRLLHDVAVAVEDHPGVATDHPDAETGHPAGETGR
ncbi:hypothetical protein [Actinoplanes philippinensis]|uniref:hypothetical protein n=1 Tax=Actinoplanes philippinensis TaxID=35752 RepID=UPI0033DE723A